MLVSVPVFEVDLPDAILHSNLPSFYDPYPNVAVLEVLVFGRDAGMAEAWLCSQEPLVRSAELGCTVDEVESLIKRHEAFQKSAVAWEERFSALEKLTAVRTVGPQRCPTPLPPHFFPSHRTASLSACELRVLFCSMSVSLGARDPSASCSNS